MLDLPCEVGVEVQEYRSHLQSLVQQHTRELPGNVAISDFPEWQQEEIIPDSVAAQSQSVGIKLTLEQWANFTLMQRFVLIKLSRSQHENKNFSPLSKSL